MGLSGTVIGLGAAAAWFTLFVLLHLALLRSGQLHSGPMLRVAVGAAFSLVVTIVGSVFLFSGTASLVLALASGCLTFGCLFVLYMPFFYTLTTSLSVETLILLLQGGGSLTEEELNRRFASEQLATGRLAAMEKGGYVVTSKDDIVATSRGRIVATTFAALKSLWRLGAGG